MRGNDLTRLACQLTIMARVRVRHRCTLSEGRRSSSTKTRAVGCVMCRFIFIPRADICHREYLFMINLVTQLYLFRCCRARPGSLTAYAFRTNPKHELTQFGAGLYSAGNALSLFCLMKIFFFRGHRASDLALSCLATLFFSLYLVFDTYR